MGNGVLGMGNWVWGMGNGAWGLGRKKNIFHRCSLYDDQFFSWIQDLLTKSNHAGMAAKTIGL
jgi:hypothetical protein